MGFVPISRCLLIITTPWNSGTSLDLQHADRRKKVPAGRVEMKLVLAASSKEILPQLVAPDTARTLQPEHARCVDVQISSEGGQWSVDTQCPPCMLYLRCVLNIKLSPVSVGSAADLSL